MEESRKSPPDLQLIVRDIGQALQAIGRIELDGPTQISLYYLNTALVHTNDALRQLEYLRYQVAKRESEE